MVINEGDSRRKVNFSALLDPSQLTDRLGHWTFLEDAEGFPEHQHRVHSFFHFLIEKHNGWL